MENLPSEVIAEKLIEEAVNSYKTAEQKFLELFRNILSGANKNEEEFNKTLEVLEKRRKIIKRLFNDSLSSSLKGKAHDIRKIASNILHKAAIKEYPTKKINIVFTNKEGEPTSSCGVIKKENAEIEKTALKAIRDTLSITEELL